MVDRFVVLAEAIDAVVNAGYLDTNSGGLGDAQKKLYAAWLVLHPERGPQQPEEHKGSPHPWVLD